MVEHLRAGVPSTEAASLLSSGRQRLSQEVLRDLEATAGGSPHRPRIIAGGYGEGKSHSLAMIAALAEQENFVVSHLTVSRETPLDRADRVYRRIVQRTHVPAVARPGLDILLDKVQGNAERVQRLLRFAAQELHQKLALVLEARFEGEFGRSEDLDRDLQGYLLSGAEARRAYREATGRRAAMFQSPRMRDDISYLRLMQELALQAGYAGWVVLVDEVEMIGRLGRVGRGRSYALIDHLADRERFARTYLVLAVASSFQHDLKERLEELEQLPGWLAGHGRGDLVSAAQTWVRRLQEAAPLPPLTEEDYVRVFDAIVQAHALAYDWQPPLGGREVLNAVRASLQEHDLKVRQLVRAAVHYLDLLRHYGEPPRLTVQGISEAAVGWDAHEEEEPLGPDEAVRRDWPD